MTIPDFTIGQGDTLPVLTRTLDDVNGPIDLTNATSVTLILRSKWLNAFYLSVACAILTPKTAGNISYGWRAADTALVGDYLAEFLVIFGDGTRVTIPNSPAKTWIQIVAT